MQLYWMFLLFTAGRGCTVSRELTQIQLLPARVQAAEDDMKDGVITLPVVEARAPQTPLPADVVQAPIGTMAKFFCQPPNKAVERLVWKHQNVTVYANNTPLVATSKSGNVAYGNVKSSGDMHLLILNVTRESAGKVECWQYCSHGLCLIKKYDLEPVMTKAKDLFIGAFMNLTAPYGKFAFTCTARFYCDYPGTGAFFIWKLRDSFVVSLKKHYLRDMTNWPMPDVANVDVSSNTSPRDHKEPFCETTLRVTMVEGRGHPPLRVQCWVRTDRNTEKYFVQSAYVHFR
ncbi:uncharacterized protein LOC129595481 [Paramacrobiotus metropolitanus]|uniref:uncharacterized protein LOC129595481 n=1 Tax=Paramacrobiotus metropolitanus TaxID=2943436 RepID=UPI00244638AB|nr:uncharacterized protein LOC129595481 [Paramacrobiotus metropolitanus]